MLFAWYAHLLIYTKIYSTMDKEPLKTLKIKGKIEK